MQGGSVLQVVSLPAGAQDVALAVDDGGFVPITGLLRLEFRSGLFSKLTLRNAPTGGTLRIYAGTEPIPFVSGGAGAALHNDCEISWPQYGTNLAGGSGWPTTAHTRWGDGSPVYWAAKDGIGADGMTVVKGRLCGFLSSGAGLIAGRNAGGATMHPLLVRPPATSFRCPAQLRVWTFSVTIARSVLVNWTDQSGVALLLSAGPAGGWMGVVGNAGIGVVGDGAGGWMYVSRKGGVLYTEAVPLVWPVAQTEYATLGFQIRSADGAREAEFSLYVNDALTITRSWGAGTLLPDYTVFANAARFLPYVRAGDAALASQLLIASSHASAGCLDLFGAEVYG